MNQQQPLNGWSAAYMASQIAAKNRQAVEHAAALNQQSALVAGYMAQGMSSDDAQAQARRQHPVTAQDYALNRSEYLAVHPEGIYELDKHLYEPLQANELLWGFIWRSVVSWFLLLIPLGGLPEPAAYWTALPLAVAISIGLLVRKQRIRAQKLEELRLKSRSSGATPTPTAHATQDIELQEQTQARLLAEWQAEQTQAKEAELARAMSEIREQLAAAVTDRSQVWIWYLEQQDDSVQTLVEPSVLENGFLVALDVARGERRTFALDRIDGFSPLGGPTVLAAEERTWLMQAASDEAEVRLWLANGNGRLEPLVVQPKALDEGLLLCLDTQTGETRSVDLSLLHGATRT